MIIDCHTHIWESPDQLGKALLDLQVLAHRGMEDGPGERGLPDASIEEHQRASEPVDKSFVLGFKSRYLDAEIPSGLIFGYVRQFPDKLIGVAGIDPTNLPEALEEMSRAESEFGMRAITVSPASQDFHPADSRAMQVFTEAARLHKPVFVHQGIHFSSASKMQFAKPALLDEVARELPRLKMVIAHMGYPWIEECIVLLGKHPNVFADISSLLHRPWQAYNALLSAYQYGVMDKLLFGSNFPHTGAAQAIQALYRINQLVTGTNLPTIPRQFLASIVERDTLSLLGMRNGGSPASEENSTALIDTEP